MRITSGDAFDRDRFIKNGVNQITSEVNTHSAGLTIVAKITVHRHY